MSKKKINTVTVRTGASGHNMPAPPPPLNAQGQSRVTSHFLTFPDLIYSRIVNQKNSYGVIFNHGNPLFDVGSNDLYS